MGRLKLVRESKQLGFSLAEIQQDIHNGATAALTPAQNMELLKERIASIEQRIEDLQDMKQNPLAKISYVQRPDYTSCSVSWKVTPVPADMASCSSLD